MAHPTSNVLDMATRLIRGSDSRSYDPFNRVSYQSKLNPDRWQYPEHLISLYHHPIYSELTDEQKWRLALLEGVNFFSFNIHGEQALVAGMEPRLYRNKRVGEDPVSSEYLQRFIHEENSHTYMLAGYCNRYYGALFADQNMAVRQTSLSTEGDDALFYGRILVLEFFLGHVNKSAFDDPDVDRTAQDIHRFHHSDEARHKAWDKVMVAENVQRLHAAGREEEIDQVRQALDDYVRYVCNATINPRVYRTLGLENPLVLRNEVQKSRARQQLDHSWISALNTALAHLGF